MTAAVYLLALIGVITVLAVVGLGRCDPWGLDTANNDALAAALRVAVALVESSADMCRSVEARFDAVVTA